MSRTGLAIAILSASLFALLTYCGIVLVGTNYVEASPPLAVPTESNPPLKLATPAISAFPSQGKILQPIPGDAHTLPLVVEQKPVETMQKDVPPAVTRTHQYAPYVPKTIVKSHCECDYPTRRIFGRR